MDRRAEAIVLSVVAHGENAAVVRVMTSAFGMVAGYVAGARSRALRPVLQPGNVVFGSWRGGADRLGQLSVELIESRAALQQIPLAAAALVWLTALTATALPEGQAHPRLHAALGGTIGAVAIAPAARGWAASLALYELLLLADLGFGLELDRCTATGSVEDLCYVSPRSGGAVSRDAAAGYEHRLLRLPAMFGAPLSAAGEAWPDILDALAVTGHFLKRDILVDRARDILEARHRLVDRLKAVA